MSAMLWKTAGEERMREFVIEQDKRFQVAMRASLRPEAPKPPKRIVMQPRREVRDVISISSGIALLRKPTSWQVIINETCLAHQVSRSELTGSQRSRQIVVARHEAMYRMKTETTMSLQQIGHRLGDRDHTTVLHGVRCHTAKLKGEVYRRERAVADSNVAMPL